MSATAYGSGVSQPKDSLYDKDAGAVGRIPSPGLNRSSDYIPDARRHYAAHLEEAITLVLRSPAPS